MTDNNDIIDNIMKTNLPRSDQDRVKVIQMQPNDVYGITDHIKTTPNDVYGIVQERKRVSETQL